MVALLVVALVLGATTSAVVSFTGNHAHLVDKTMAGWVAANRLAELRLGLAVGDGDDATGTERMGRREWSWRISRAGTGRPELERLTVQVIHPDEPDRVFFETSGMRLIERGPAY